MSVPLSDIVRYLDRELRISELPDYPGAINGLQLDGGGGVQRIAVAVDASLPVVRRAVGEGAQLLLVHHGMFWNGTKPVTGPLYEKLKLAMDAGMGIYSAHLPLDVHPRFGNNACLAEALAIAAAGIDTFVTGEGPHWSYTAAEELGLNVLYGGHYATETFGVKALGDHLASRCGCEWSFIDHPSGL